MKLKQTLLLTAAICVISGGAYAAGGHEHHMMMAKPDAGALKNPSTKEYVAAMGKMHREMAITYSGDTDIDFAKGMVPHHQGAVDMIDTLLKYGKDAELRKKAEFMKQMQTLEIGQMTHWLNLRGELPGIGGAAPAAHGKSKPASSVMAEKPVVAFEKANTEMHRGMDVKYTGNADIDFIRGMIPHHQGAVDMAKVQLKYGKNLEMNKLAEGIISSQQQEIAWMQDRLAVLEGKAKK